MFIHLGFGAPQRRSYELIKCEYITSTCAKKYGSDTYIAEYVDKVMFRLQHHITELQNPIHEYRYSGRVYKVYPFTEELWNLLKTVMSFSYRLHEYCKNSGYCYAKVVGDLSTRCEKGIEECVNAVREWEEYIERIRWVKREAGEKAFVTMLRKSHEKCLPVLQKYFSDVLNYLSFRDRVNDPVVYVNDSNGYSECFHGVFNYLKKFFDEERARRYADRMCRGFNTVFLLARDGIIVLDLRYTPDPVDIYAMECVDKPSYAMVKLVAVRSEPLQRARVDWIALLGLDKPTNQIFIHYVPRTFVFRDLETCRKWVMGLVDNRGYPTEYSYELIEA